MPTRIFPNYRNLLSDGGVDPQKCLDAGCDDFATKPIDRTKLVDVVRAYAQKPVPDAEVSTSNA